MKKIIVFTFIAQGINSIANPPKKPAQQSHFIAPGGAGIGFLTAVFYAKLIKPCIEHREESKPLKPKLD